MPELHGSLITGNPHWGYIKKYTWSNKPHQEIRAGQLCSPPCNTQSLFFFFSPRQRGRRKVFEFKLPGNTIIYVQGEKNIQECQAQALGTCVAEAVVACGAFSSSLSTLLSLFESRQASRQGPGCTKGHCPLGSRERITLSEASQYESTKNE